jgi:hypothetical protein
VAATVRIGPGARARKEEWGNGWQRQLGLGRGGALGASGSREEGGRSGGTGGSGS